MFLLPKMLEWALVSNIQIKLTIKNIVLSHVWTSPDAELGFSISAKFLSVYVHNFGKQSCYHQNLLAFSFCHAGLRLKISWAPQKQTKSKSSPKHHLLHLSCFRSSAVCQGRVTWVPLSWAILAFCFPDLDLFFVCRSEDMSLDGGHDSKTV